MPFSIVNEVEIVWENVLLIFLLVCHYLSDFCLTTPKMIRAKSDGRNPLPIMLHAAIHAGLMAICLLLWAISWKAVLLAMAVEWGTHFLIDWTKAQLSAHLPILADNRQKPYCMHLFSVMKVWEIMDFGNPSNISK